MTMVGYPCVVAFMSPGGLRIGSPATPNTRQQRRTRAVSLCPHRLAKPLCITFAQVCYQSCASVGNFSPSRRARLRRSRRQHGRKRQVFYVCPACLLTWSQGRARAHSMLFARVAVPAFDPSAAAAAKQYAGLLGAAEEHLGNLLAELYVAMPSLAACGFKASFGKQPQANTLMRRASSRTAGGSQGRDATSTAVAAVTPSVGVDTQALHTLVSKAREALAQITA